ALRGRAAAASPSRVASSIRGYLTDKVGSLQLRDTAESLLSLPKRWLSTQGFGTEDEEFQNVQLPKLPVPDLQETLDTYLELAAVVVSGQQLETSRAVVRGFMEELGPRLQEALLDRQREMDNWVTEWWLDDMYMKVRLPLPINSSPGMVFPRRRFGRLDEVADLAALFIDDLLDYKEMLDRGELPLERATSREKGQPLCMEQFYRLLGVCRVAEVGRDRLELPARGEGEQEELVIVACRNYFYRLLGVCRVAEVGRDRLELPARGEGEQEELVIVACRNYFYPIPVKAADRGRLTPGEMQAQLLHAMVDAAGAPLAPRVGLLTSMDRDKWAKAREHLIRDENNRTNLELISRALCIVCLDEGGGDRPDLDADTNAMLRAMHGAGTRHHSANRWFDKTVQLIISSDGMVGMCYEHSAAEGVAVVRLAERALARAEVADRPAPPPALLPAPVAMRWNVTPDVQRTIETAARDLDRAIGDLDHKVYTYTGYGREFMKSCRASPDVYIQLALQYAYYKMYGYLVSTYESASLRRFRNGRVDNIRSAHDAALAWAAAMCTAETPPLGDADDGQKKVSFNLYGEQKKLELFEEAVRKQTSIMEANILGRGIDNHLLGLREAAREALGSLPALFTDPTYKQMIEYKLSTSQVATTTDGTFMGYGAVVPDGYGCSYNPKKDCVIFCISSFTSSSVTNTEAFRQSLEEALDSMKLMFQNKKPDN
ncbi:choline O-acetyltransferase, partial [Ostrinia nubilalis]|uniref:choline O-acetyltransferase n=1 Tax=Ostrinia nubilalis TaxID=29057 RepID=UPI0030824EF6